MATNRNNKSNKAQLCSFFRRNGCFRVPDRARQKKEKRAYKKGYETRFMAFDRKELATIRALLRKAGFKAGKPYPKHTYLIQPVYGRGSYERFREWI